MRLNVFLAVVVGLLVVSNVFAWIKILDVNLSWKPCVTVCAGNDNADEGEPVSQDTDFSDLKEQVDYLAAELADQRAVVEKLKEQVSVPVKNNVKNEIRKKGEK